MATILRLLAAASAALVLVGTPAGAAEPDLPKLGITPVGQDGDFFQLTLEPGAVHTLEVELANQGDSPIAARTYAADVATIVNGGFGAGLRDAPSGGTTSWVDYPADVFQLDPDQAVNRTFTVTVPAATPPGEYITSLVIENDEPVRGSGDVAVEQVLRQAIAVAVTVPGPLRGALTVGGNGSHTVVEPSHWSQWGSPTPATGGWSRPASSSSPTVPGRSLRASRWGWSRSTPAPRPRWRCRWECFSSRGGTSPR